MALSANYVLTYTGANFLINTRAITVSAQAKTKIYGSADPALTYQISSGTLASGDDFTGSLARTTDENVGSYPIAQGTLALTANYALTFEGAAFTITPRPISVNAQAKTKIYGSADPVLTYQISAGALVSGDGFTGSLARATGENVGSYAISQGTLALNGNYSLSFAGASLSITPASLSVKANDIVIFVGQIPVYTSTITGFVNGDMQSSVVSGGPDYSVSGDFLTAGTYTITPSNLKLFLSSNYVVGSYLTGMLTVNPACPLDGKAVRPVLRCIEALTNHPSGFKFVAHFEYQNENSTAIFIPLGPDNKLVSADAFSGTPPELFLAGGGKFDVYFTGTKLTWTITSCDRGKKTSIGSVASSTSTRCQKGNSSSRDASPATASLEMPKEVSVFPNPVIDYVTLSFDDSMEQPSSSDILIVDRVGRPVPVKAIWYQETHQLEVDFSDMNKGLYIIKVNTQDGTKTVKVLK